MGGRQGLVQAGRAAGFALAHARLHVRLGSDSRGSALPAPLPPNAAARVRAPGQPPAPCPRVPCPRDPRPPPTQLEQFPLQCQGQGIPADS